MIKEPTWAQVNCLVVLVAICGLFAIYAWFRGKREEEKTVRMSRGWEEYKKREREEW